MQIIAPSIDEGEQTDQEIHHADAPLKVAEQIRSVLKSENKSSPITHIGFLKVHKAASTTTQALFLRFGWRRNLTFVLSPEYNKFGYPNIISTNESITKYNTLPPPSGKTFDMLCNHVVYGHKEWSTVLPLDSAIVGTVREPFSHFNSVLNYFNPRAISFVQSAIDPVDPVGTFLKNPTKFEAKNIRQSFTNNRLAFEYGVDPQILASRDFAGFDKYLKEVLDKQFIIVLLSDKYDESLVMMKRKLNWSLDDIMYALKNVRSATKLNRYNMKDQHKALHRNYSTFDYLLYEFFKEKLSKQINDEGPSFKEEVDNFKEVRTYIEHFCHAVPKHIKSVKVGKSRWTESFDIAREDCDIMHKGEIPFVQMIRRSQYGSATWTGVQKPVKELPKNVN